MEIISRRSAWIRFRRLAGVVKQLGNPPVDSAYVLATSKSGTLLLRRDQGEMAVL